MLHRYLKVALTNSKHLKLCEVTLSLPCYVINTNLYILRTISFSFKAWWRNGSASDSRSEGCVFKSRPGHFFFHYRLP